jgi:rRNA small subunit pseudouridine methyltransferase Nep1
MKIDSEAKQSKLVIIIAESEIEPIPTSIQNHPQIKSYVKKKNRPVTNLLLDASFHHAAMKKLPDWSRRGRPDIVHRCALLALDSWANHNGFLQIYIHTRDDYVITINPKTRLPRQYHRFVGLIEQLIEKREICSSDENLLTYKKKTLKQLLADQKNEVVLLWEKGQSISIVDLIESKKGFPLTIVIGGFPHGDFHQSHTLIEQKISVESESYTASYLLAKTIITYEQTGCNHK